MSTPTTPIPSEGTDSAERVTAAARHLEAVVATALHDASATRTVGPNGVAVTMTRNADLNRIARACRARIGEHVDAIIADIERTMTALTALRASVHSGPAASGWQATGLVDSDQRREWEHTPTGHRMWLSDGETPAAEDAFDREAPVHDATHEHLQIEVDVESAPKATTPHTDAEYEALRRENRNLEALIRYMDDSDPILVDEARGAINGEQVSAPAHDDLTGGG